MFRRISLLSPAVGTANIGDELIEQAIRRMLAPEVAYQAFGVRTPLSAEDIEAINATDCALVCGTNLYQREWHPALTPEILEQIRVPVIPFGVGGSAATLEEIDPGRTTVALIRALHKKCAAGGARDPYSAAMVAAAGVSNSMLTGCPVLFWSGAETLPEVRPAERRRVVLTARNWLMHRWPDNVDHPVQIAFLRKVLDGLAGEDVVFAIHEPFDENLVERLKLPAEAVIRSADASDYIGLYSNPRHLVIAMRLHAGMLAMANGVPAVFIGHDTRSYSFCEMMGQECIRLFAENAAEECIARVRAILAGETGEFGRAQAAYRGLHGTMTDFLRANELPARGAEAARGSESVFPQAVQRR